jgi:hypothetical protein
MKKKHLILILLLALFVASLMYVYSRQAYFARAARYEQMLYATSYTDSMEDMNASLFIALRKSADVEGKAPAKTSHIEEADILGDITRETVRKMSVSTRGTSYKLDEAYDFSTQTETLQALQVYERFIKKHYVYALPTLQNITNEAYLHTQSLAEAMFVSADLTARILTCQQHILTKMLSRYELQAQPFHVVPFLQTKKQTYREGEIYEATLYLLHPVSFGAGKAKATLNGNPIALDKNGMAHITLPAGKAGKHTWEGALSCQYQGRDTTFYLKRTYTVLP